jgi:uncharacterized membrane protein YkvA (DUF1232 family)
MSGAVVRGQKGILAMLAHPRGMWEFLRDPKAPRRVRVVAVLALLYLISPVDAVPELFAPLVGWLDDLGAAAVALTWLASQGAKYENARAQREAEGIRVEPAVSASAAPASSTPAT